MRDTLEQRALIDRAVAGDRIALEQLMLDYYSSLAGRIASRIPSSLRTKVSADDIVQQTYMRVFQNINRFEPRSDTSFFGWLCTIADNRIQDEQRALHRKKNEGGYDRIAAEFIGELEGGGHTPSKSIARREAVSAIHVAMAGLPDHYRQAIQLRFFQRCSLEQIAEQMERTPGAVRGLLDRAKQELRDAMGRASLYLNSR